MFANAISVIEQLASRFRVQSLRPIQTHRNLVYFATRHSGEDAVLKLRTGDVEGPLTGEMEFMAFLHSEGVRVPLPYRSSAERLVESEHLDSTVLCACCIQRIRGEPWHVRPPSVTDIEQVGALAGSIAVAAPRYRTAASAQPSWRDAAWLSAPEKAIHPSMAGVIAQAIALRTQLEALPTEAFGLVHDDLHSGNVLFADGMPFAIDFENSRYTWHASEVASALFFHLWKTRQSDPAELKRRASTFLAAFLSGYCRHHPLSRFWIMQIPLFLKLRELSMFASSGLQREDFSKAGSADDHFAFLKENLEHAIPYVDLDFACFA